MSFCQDHKRAGMYTSRNGKWLVATNDGNGECVPGYCCTVSTSAREMVGHKRKLGMLALHDCHEGSVVMGDAVLFVDSKKPPRSQADFVNPGGA